MAKKTKNKVGNYDFLKFTDPTVGSLYNPEQPDIYFGINFRWRFS